MKPRNFLIFYLSLFKNILNTLFSRPEGFKGYLLGILLGFIPCGLLYGAIIIAANINNFMLAGFAMFVFGIATIPSLLVTSYSGFLFLNKFKEKSYGNYIDWRRDMESKVYQFL